MTHLVIKPIKKRRGDQSGPNPVKTTEISLQTGPLRLIVQQKQVGAW
jgi:hypothetical protein